MEEEALFLWLQVREEKVPIFDIKTSRNIYECRLDVFTAYSRYGRLDRNSKRVEVDFVPEIGSIAYAIVMFETPESNRDMTVEQQYKVISIFKDQKEAHSFKGMMEKGEYKQHLAKKSVMDKIEIHPVLISSY